jgi:hypothetical protein
MNPWWGNPHDGSTSFAKQMFDTYALDTSLYGITDDVEKADMVFPPYKHQWFMRYDMPLWQECVETARKAGKPLLVDGAQDVEPPLGVPNAYVLRIGGYRFIHNEPGRITVPTLVDDLLERCENGELKIRPKQSAEKPVVGFAGWAELSFKQKMRTMLKESPVRLRALFDRRYRTMVKGVFWRAKAIRILQESPKVTMNLKSRQSFSGSTKTAHGSLETLRREFVDTILGSDYGLEVRGDPNASNRLFEVCALGRIPVVIDTERNLPWSDVLDYREFCLMVDYRDINRLGDIVADFHSKITPERFEEMQRRAREVYVNYFRIDSLMKHIIDALTAQGVI